MNSFLYALGRGLQLLGLALTGVAAISGFRGDPEIAFIVPCGAGLLAFYAGVFVLRRFARGG